EAIGGKARCRDCDTADAFLWVSRKSGIGRRLEPFGATESRLECDVDFAPERFRDEPRGFLAVAVVRVAERERALRHAVEAQQQALRLEIERVELASEIGPKHLDVE